MQEEPGRSMVAPQDAGPPMTLRGEPLDIARHEKTGNLQVQTEANISHELRTSLAVVTLLSGNLDLLYERLDDARRQKMIRDIRKHTRKLNDLIGEILELCNIVGPISV